MSRVNEFWVWRLFWTHKADCCTRRLNLGAMKNTDWKEERPGVWGGGSRSHSFLNEGSEGLSAVGGSCTVALMEKERKRAELHSKGEGPTDC